MNNHSTFTHARNFKELAFLLMIFSNILRFLIIFEVRNDLVIVELRNNFRSHPKVTVRIGSLTLVSLDGTILKLARAAVISVGPTTWNTELIISGTDCVLHSTIQMKIFRFAYQWVFYIFRRSFLGLITVLSIIKTDIIWQQLMIWPSNL